MDELTNEEFTLDVGIYEVPKETRSNNSFNTTFMYYLYKIVPKENADLKQVTWDYVESNHIADVEPGAFRDLPSLEAIRINGAYCAASTGNFPRPIFTCEDILYANEGIITVLACPQKYLTSHDEFKFPIQNLHIGDYAFYSVDFKTRSKDLFVSEANSNGVIADLAGVFSIGDCAFAKSNIRAFVINEMLCKLGRYAFAFCIELNEVLSTVSSTNVKCIPSGAFYGCENLTTVNLPEGIIYIGDKAFKGCHNLSEITLPKSVQCICKDAFSECGNIKINIPEGSHLMHLGIEEADYLAGEPELNKKLIMPDIFDSASGEEIETSELSEGIFTYYRNKYSINKQPGYLGADVNFICQGNKVPEIITEYGELK